MSKSNLAIDKLIEKLKSDRSSLKEHLDILNNPNIKLTLREYNKDIYVCNNDGEREETKKNLIKEIVRLDGEIGKLEGERANFIDTTYINNEKLPDRNNNTSKLSDYLLLNEKEQTIKIGFRTYCNFETLFKGKKIKYTPSQLKGGMSLLYAIAKIGSNSKLLVSDLLPHCLEFKRQWRNRIFEKKGIQKKAITINDCDSASHILTINGLPITFKLSKDKTTISIGE